jgi:hypothetical protein
MIGVAGLIGLAGVVVVSAYVGYCGQGIPRLKANVLHSRLKRVPASLAPPAHAGPAQKSQMAARALAKATVFEDLTRSRITISLLLRSIEQPLPNANRWFTLAGICVELQHIVYG